MRKEAASLMRLGQIIAADVSLSAGLMKISNSAYFGLGGKVHSIGDALTILGLDVASRAIAVASLRASFPLTPKLDRFWNASAQIAALSGWLAKIVIRPCYVPMLRIHSGCSEILELPSC
jgi:HD-like signal output (HDOD) protein